MYLFCYCSPFAFSLYLSPQMYLFMSFPFKFLCPFQLRYADERAVTQSQSQHGAFKDSKQASGHLEDLQQLHCFLNSGIKSEVDWRPDQCSVVMVAAHLHNEPWQRASDKKAMKMNFTCTDGDLQ